jgi:hypothetical protein
MEMKKLSSVITEAELERDRQRKEFISVLSERDVLRTQVWLLCKWWRRKMCCG